MIAKNDGEEHHVRPMQDKVTKKWRVVNLTKGHICPCQFDTKEDCVSEIYSKASRITEITAVFYRPLSHVTIEYNLKRDDKNECSDCN